MPDHTHLYIGDIPSMDELWKRETVLLEYTEKVRQALSPSPLRTRKPDTREFDYLMKSFDITPSIGMYASQRILHRMTRGYIQIVWLTHLLQRFLLATSNYSQ